MIKYNKLFNLFIIKKKDFFNQIFPEGKIKLYKKQKYILTIGSLLLIILVVMKLNLPHTFKTGYIVLIVILVVVLLIDTKFRKDFNKGVEYSDHTLELISLNICPICTKNKVGNFRIKVGYIFDRSFIQHKILRIGNARKSDEITGSVPICETCKEEFLSFRISDPSKLVLGHKAGCHRGLFNPYGKENVFIEM